MKIVLHNLYGLRDNNIAYFRKLGDCYDFVWNKNFATDLSIEEVEEILKYQEYYCKQYNASHMTIN